MGKFSISQFRDFWLKWAINKLLHIFFLGMRSHDSLIQLFDPLFEKLAASSWESVGMNHIWNPRRPIWFQSIIHLIEPHLVPVIQDLLR